MLLEKIQALPCWVLYKIDWHGNQTKKIPINPKNGKAASVTDSTHWTDYKTAVAAQNKYNANGVGVVFDEAPIKGNLHLTGIDIDHCLDAATNSATPVALEIGRKLDSYTEISPSGAGLHILVLSSVSAGWKNPKYGLEIYSRERYFTFTGNRIPSLNPEICDRTTQLKEILKQYFPKNVFRNKIEPPPTCVLSGYAEDSDDNKILEKMFGSRNGDKLQELYSGVMSNYQNDHSSADLALACQLAYWTNNNAPQMDRLFRKSALMRPKWDSRRGSSTYGQQTLHKALELRKKGDIT